MYVLEEAKANGPGGLGVFEAMLQSDLLVAVARRHRRRAGSLVTVLAVEAKPISWENAPLKYVA